MLTAFQLEASNMLSVLARICHSLGVIGRKGYLEFSPLFAIDYVLLIQFHRDELERDVDHVCNLIMCDSKFEGTLKNMKRRDIAGAVSEAFNLLFSAPGPGVDRLDITPDACMVIAILQQLLIRLLTKRLMNLMTAEAIILNRNKIPYSYLGHYLSNQAHFSLKDTIKNYHTALAATSL